MFFHINVTVKFGYVFWLCWPVILPVHNFSIYFRPQFLESSHLHPPLLNLCTLLAHADHWWFCWKVTWIINDSKCLAISSWKSADISNSITHVSIVAPNSFLSFFSAMIKRSAIFSLSIFWCYQILFLRSNVT